MTKRRLYVYTHWDVYNSVKDSACYFSVELFLNLTSVGKLPVQSGGAKNLLVINQSMYSIGSGLNGNSVSSLPANCLRVNLASPQTGGPNEIDPIFLNPYEFTAEIDTVKLNFDRMVNAISYYRAILAMASTTT